jgi:hypothetical protein
MLKLHAGVSKKVGLPGFSRATASCSIEAERDFSLLQDHDGFQTVVQRAYQSCEKAIADQIARLTSDGPSDASQPQEVVEVRTSPAVSGARITTNSAETRKGLQRTCPLYQKSACRPASVLAECGRLIGSMIPSIRRGHGLARSSVPWEYAGHALHHRPHLCIHNTFPSIVHSSCGCRDLRQRAPC